jgi:hypothetical protein
MNEQEFQALLSILSRAPLSPAEALWLNALIARLAAEIEAKKAADGRLD